MAPRRLRARPERAVFTAAVALVAVLALVPVGYLVWGAFFDDSGPTLGHFRDAYRSFGLGSMLVDSLLFAAGSTALAVALGGALAFLVVRTDAPLRRFAAVGAVVPLVIPGVLYTFAWILIGSPRVGLLSGVGFDIFGVGGMVLVQGLHLAPVPFLLMAAAFRSMDATLEEAALASGARPATVVRRITLPLTAPALYASILLTAIAALESFEVPVLIGIPSGTWVLTSRIWAAFSQTPSDLGQAGAYSCSLLLLTAVGLFAYWRRTAGRGRFETLAGGGARPHRFALGRWRAPAGAAMGLAVAALALLPLAMLAYCSLQPVYTVPSLHGLTRLTLSHYGDAVGGASLRAFGNSLLLGAATASVVMLAMSVIAWILVRTRWRARWAVDLLASTPLVVPGLALAVGVLFVYLRSPVPVYGTLWILLIAYVTRFMPHGVRFATAAIRRLSGELEDAARVSGASWWQTFRRVDLPLLAPGLAAGWILVFILSMRELSTSILLYSPGSEVVPVRIWQQFQEGEFAGPAATGILLVAVLGALAGAGWWLARTRLRRAVAA